MRHLCILRIAVSVLCGVAGLAMITLPLALLNHILPDSVPTSARVIMLGLAGGTLWGYISDRRVGIDLLGRVRKLRKR